MRIAVIRILAIAAAAAFAAAVVSAVAGADSLATVALAIAPVAAAAGGKYPYKVVDGRIRSPGKFEGEAWWVPLAWALSLDGGAEELEPEEDGAGTNFLTIGESERTAWGLPDTVAAILLRYRSDGFVSGFTLTTQALYERIDEADRLNSLYWCCKCGDSFSEDEPVEPKLVGGDPDAYWDSLLGEEPLCPKCYKAPGGAA